MAMGYDEIQITTRREINVCKGAIKKLEKSIADWEKKYNLSSIDLRRDYDLYTHPPNGDFIQWHDSCIALERWQERLAAHWQIMEM
jgi:hypothetical protein